MNTNHVRRWMAKFGLAPACALAAVLFLLIWSMRTHAQNNTRDHTPVPVTSDWSNRHMVYSAPASAAQAQRLQAEPRYLNQLKQRNAKVPQVKDAR